MIRGRDIARALGLVVAVAIAPALAGAQAQPKVTARASATQVEVGEAFTIELKALVDQGTSVPSDPQLRAPAGFTVQGPSVSQQTMAQFGGGRSSVQVGLGATWQLVAPSPGHFVIPGPTVRWNSQRFTASSITIDVVQATGRQHATPNNPFLLPGGPGLNLPFPFGHDQTDDRNDDTSGGNPDLALPNALDPDVFLHAIVDKKSAVVGEQVTISFYIYHAVDFELTERHEAPLAEFLRVPLLKNPGTDPPVVAIAGGRRFTVRLLDRVGIFPVHPGELHTGKMSGRFNGRRIGAHVLRESEDIVIRATEPPVKDRPTGYALGDVGKFELSAAVQPRRVDQGGSVAVSVKVAGTGNLPSTIKVPEKNGIEWLDPEKKEQIDVSGGVVGGQRTFGYVVVMKDSGTVDLGTIELPYWDPQAKKYAVTTAKLGTIDVNPVTKSPSAGDPPPTSRDPFVAMPGARLTLGAFTPAPRASLFDGPRFWALLGAAPLLVGLFFAGKRAGESMQKRREQGKSSPSTLAQKALREASAETKRGDAKAVAAALERALHHAIESATGLKSRGILLEDLRAEMEQHGVGGDLARETCETLATCGALRFDPLAEGARDIDERARKVVAALGKVAH